MAAKTSSISTEVISDAAHRACACDITGGDESSKAAQTQEDRLYSREEVLSEVASGGRRLVIITKIVYDVTAYVSRHPGGAEILEDAIGGDATTDFEAIGHSNAARTIMQTMRVGRIA